MATRYNDVPRGNGAPMGVETVARLGTSLDDLETAKNVKHLEGGVHNDILVPRASCTLEWDSGKGKAFLHESRGIVTVRRIAAGFYVFELASESPVVGAIVTPIDAFAMPEWLAYYPGFLQVRLSVPVDFRAYRSGSNQTLVDSTADIVEFQTEDHDLGGGYSISTFTFTVPTDGRYDFSSVVHVQDQAGAAGVMQDAYAMFYIDGAEAQRYGIHILASNVGNGVASLGMSRTLTAGQTVDVRVYIKGSDTPGSKILFGSNLSWFSGRQARGGGVDGSLSLEVYTE